jgi:pyruvate dehydrogenase E2 component (dihydrolipoyllysine-residue acetyltransferase)
MPQMGESIAEGTIVRWMKKVGDSVERDEPLFEITTDKVDAEIPAPVAGVLTDIKVKEGETVAVNTVVATIGQPGEKPASAEDSTPATAGQARSADEAASAAAVDAAASANGSLSPRRSSQPQGAESVRAAANAAAASTQPQADGQPHSIDELRRRKSSPLVRRIARDNNVDITQIRGSGIGGRVTKHDILEYLNQDVRPRSAAQFPRAVPPPPAPSPGAPAPELRPAAPSDRIEIQPLSPMRKKIAEHMVLSRRTSAHVHSVFHVDFSHVERIRREKKDEYARLGARLTYLAFIGKAVIDAIRRHPIINASLDGDNVVYKKDVNLGIAVALESGLIVPVVKNADEKNVLGLSRAIADVADRARAKQLKPDEVHGGTFTITNPGQFGAQFGMPIINQPQVAILGVGTIERRPVVIDDAIAIRTMAYLTLGYDHRLIDGAVADQFMADVKQQIEHFDASHV